MIAHFLRKTAAAAAAMIALTSCGKMVTLMDSEVAEPNASAAGASAVKVTETTEPSTEPVTEQFTLDIKMPEGYEIPKKYAIPDFKTVLQKPELPTGCEVTALCEVLQYLCFDIDKVALSDEFMPMDNNGITTMKTAYIGDPKSDEGFGCFAPVIVQTADDYFESVNSPCYAVDITGSSMNEIYYQVSQGRPVVIWSTINQIITTPNLRWVTNEGEEMWFNDFQHCVAIYGYDLEEKVVHIADPLVGNVKYEISKFEQTYEVMGKQAVVICGDSNTQGDYKAPADKPQSPILSRNKAERKKAEEEEARKKAEEEERKKAEEERKKAEEEERKKAEEEEKRRAAEEAARAQEENEAVEEPAPAEGQHDEGEEEQG
ncbi:C39 family peptidase [Ruminococcus sp.]|uniref:C39 family peptidase n=1 Tax=Ruminococcus sp. TaxID=41978 RepID=UPI002B60E579|nr:C39 family peptidase [Ruminococcus sp.]HNZ98721.1 C39 family peptidase [Ruminococcus sp.]HOH87217.1 C39 family peptidase [Ruminococcus sp.]